jgi:N6-adenosine-specific RNA methylase IME4
MSIQEIQALPVGRLAAVDCALFFWVYSPMLEEALRVMRAWGFRYCSTAFVWAKCEASDSTKFRIGNGFTTRKQTELCLLGKKGKPVRLDEGVGELIVAPRRLPMQKPDEQYERIERLYPGPYIELFARKSRPRWDAWGNQVGLFDNGPVPTRRMPSGGVPEIS